MVRRRGTERRAMDQQALVRLSGPLAIAVSAAATAEGLSIPAWLRSLAVTHLEGAAKHVRPSTPPYIPSAAVEDLSRLHAWQSRLNGALVQYTKALRETGSSVHEEAETILADLRTLRRELEAFVMKEKRRACRGH